MPQLMRCQAVEPGSGRRCVEMVATRVEVAQDAAMPTGEYQLARYLPYDVPGKIAREKCWHRHRSPLVRLRRAPGEVSAYLDDRLDDLEPSTQSVDATDA
jgi:hypothetical protein